VLQRHLTEGCATIGSLAVVWCSLVDEFGALRWKGRKYLTKCNDRRAADMFRLRKVQQVCVIRCSVHLSNWIANGYVH